MVVYAKMKLRQDDGSIIEKDYVWLDFEKKAGKALTGEVGLGVQLSSTKSEAFNTFCRNTDAFKAIMNFDDIIAIKFYDDPASEADGGWLYLPKC